MKIYYHPEKNQIIGFDDESYAYGLIRFGRYVSIRRLIKYGPEALGWIYIGDL